MGLAVQDMKHLLTFKTVVEVKSFSKAGEQLYLSQSTVSTRIQQLENELGVLLFDRSSRHEVQPTAAGYLFYQHVLELLDKWEFMIQEVRKDTSQEKIRCQIAASHTFADMLLPELLKVLLQTFPDVAFELIKCNSEEVLEKVEHHKAHFGFMEEALVSQQSRRHEILKDQLVLAGNTQSDYWLMREKKSGLRYYNQVYLREMNIQSNTILPVNSNALIVQLLKQGIGQSIISQRSLVDAIPFENLPAHYVRYFYFLERPSLRGVLSQIASKILSYYQEQGM